MDGQLIICVLEKERARLAEAIEEIRIRTGVDGARRGPKVKEMPATIASSALVADLVGKPKKKRKMSAAGRRAIAKAQKARWAAQKKAAKA